MLIVEREFDLTPDQQATKASFILCLQTMNHLIEFTTVDELVVTLETGLTELAAAGYPRALSRAILIFRDEQALHAVAVRMHPLIGKLEAFKSPQVWNDAARRMPQIIEHARKVDPDWMRQVLS